MSSERNHTMTSMDKLITLSQNLTNTYKKKIIALTIALILFTKIGTLNILYILQYAECIIKLIIFQKRIKYASSTAIYNTRVHLYDIDFWFHMNNAAYLRHAELARVDFFIRTKIWKQLNKKNYSLGFIALNIRYRRELTLFKSYSIHTRALFWNELELIIEQRFIDPNTNFLHTIVYGKYVLIKNGRRVKQLMNNDNDNVEGEGLYLIKFYEKPLIVSSGNDTERPLIHVASTESITSSQNGYIEHDDGVIEPELVAQYGDNEEEENNELITRTNAFDNVYECRNKIPRSLRIWMQCLEQSSYESTRNLL
mmetsp:Transcript_40968/g.36152  ORF Transcript_40968/g.36152 Transcript_40968/m.36152 type:complete len:311 (+) Transcript_40968:23-955(+)